MLKLSIMEVYSVCYFHASEQKIYGFSVCAKIIAARDASWLS